MLYSGRVIASEAKLPGMVAETVQDLPEHTMLLDIGAGDGRMNSALAHNPTIDVVGVEYDAQLAIDTAADQNARLIVADGRILPLQSRTFDAVTSINTLHEIINARDNDERNLQLDSTAAELARVMREDGRLIIYDGLMPAHSDEPLLVQANDQAARDTLMRFGNEYCARTPKLHVAGGSTFSSDLASVVTFLTKYNYLLDGEAWEGERHQLYPFADLETLSNTLADNGFNIESVEYPDAYGRKGLQRLLANYAITSLTTGLDYTAETFPACQVMLTARKV